MNFKTVSFAFLAFAIFSNLFVSTCQAMKQTLEHALDFGTNYQPYTDLGKAAREGDAHKVLDLLQHGLNPNIKSWFYALPLYEAVENNHEDVARILLAYNADINKVPIAGANRTVLHMAVIYEHPKMISFLISKGSNPNAVDMWGFTPLHLMAQGSRIDPQQLMFPLLNNGANPNFRPNIATSEGEKLTALEYAKKRKNDDFLKIIKDWKERKVKSKL